MLRYLLPLLMIVNFGFSHDLYLGFSEMGQDHQYLATCTHAFTEVVWALPLFQFVID